MSRALEVVPEKRGIRGASRMGEMLELGEGGGSTAPPLWCRRGTRGWPVLVAVGGANARALADAALAAGMTAASVHYVINRHEAADLATTLVNQRYGAGKRFARYSHRGCGRPTQGGVCLMLYNHPLSVPTQIPVRSHSVHHVPDGGRQSVPLSSSPAARTVA